jgi:hypothetical protein
MLYGKQVRITHPIRVRSLGQADASVDAHDILLELEAKDGLFVGVDVELPLRVLVNILIKVMVR